MLTHASTGSPPTLAGNFGSVFYGVTASFLWVLLCAKFCLCSPRLESPFSPGPWKFCNQIPLALKVRLHGDSQSLYQIPNRFLAFWLRSSVSDPQAGKPGVRFRTFAGREKEKRGRTSLVVLFSSLWVTHPAVTGFHFFIMIAPLYHLATGLFFVFGRGVPFLMGSGVLLSMVVQQLVAILVLLQEEMSTHSPTLPSSFVIFI